MADLESLKQLAQEQIVGDSSITEELNDQEAIVLINWGLSIANNLVENTLDMGDEDAQTYLDEKLSRLRRVIRTINKLAGGLSSLSPDAVAERLDKVVEAVNDIPGLTVSIPADAAVLAQYLDPDNQMDALHFFLRYFQLSPRG